MSVRAVILLGLFLVAAALVHGGIYSAGQDFVLNRFTGRFQFVPAEEEDEETTPTRKASADRRADRHAPIARADRRADRRLDGGCEPGLGSHSWRPASVSARR
ncbi:MAG: hypothetical protein E6J75_13490 [Deltaproteobacteria bacterium]|nr:MAG: hypothetical protein E6J75_13490 [Deltaproteobacteria bacterium]